MKSIFAMDIGGTHTRYGFVSEKGELSHYASLPTAKWAQGDKAVEKLGNLIGSALNEHQDMQIQALSLGFPAALDKACSRIVNAPAIPALTDVPVAAMLEERLQRKVVMNRDVVMLYEHAVKALALHTGGMTLGFFIGTGMGYLIAIDGRPYNGAHGMAGELGHIPLHGLRGRCGCGGIGCAEQYTAGRALASIVRKYYPEEDIGLLFEKHLNDAPLRLYLKRLSELIAGQLTVLDPDRVLLGGGVVHMAGFPLDALTQMVKSRLRDSELSRSLRFHIAQDAQQAGVIGAGLYGWREIRA